MVTDNNRTDLSSVVETTSSLLFNRCQVLMPLNAAILRSSNESKELFCLSVKRTLPLALSQSVETLHLVRTSRSVRLRCQASICLVSRDVKRWEVQQHWLSPAVMDSCLRTKRSGIATSEQAVEGNVEAGAIFQDKDHLMLWWFCNRKGRSIQGSWVTGAQEANNK